MNRYELEVFANQRYGKTIGWMCNVINTSHSNPTTKIKGLIFLAFHNRVCPLSFSMDQILIDGYAKPWSELERYAQRFSEDEINMRMHLNDLPGKSAYDIYYAKLWQDSYHSCIQEAAKALVDRWKNLTLDCPSYGSYIYHTSYMDGSSIWQSEDGTKAISYNYATKSFDDEIN